MTVKELEELRNTDIKSVNKDSLIDLRDIKINPNLSVEQRIKEFMDKVKNPYCFMVGDVVVKVAFNPEGKSFEENFEKMLLGFS